jgi:molecular chaperone GrpE
MIKNVPTWPLVADGTMQRYVKIVNDWKLKITENYQRWLDQIETPPKASSPQAKHPPDLYSFFEALCILQSDVSKSSRRNHEAITRFKGTLDGFERTMQEMAHRFTTEQRQHGRISFSAQKQFLTPFAQILERMDRLSNKLADPPNPGFLASRRKWTAHWNTFKEGFDLLREHFQLLLRNAGIVPMETVGHLFDPAKMKAVAVENSVTVPHNTVIEELAAGYYLKDEVLKFAEVKIAINKERYV